MLGSSTVLGGRLAVNWGPVRSVSVSAPLTDARPSFGYYAFLTLEDATLCNRRMARPDSLF